MIRKISVVRMSDNGVVGDSYNRLVLNGDIDVNHFSWGDTFYLFCSDDDVYEKERSKGVVVREIILTGTRQRAFSMLVYIYSYGRFFGCEEANETFHQGFDVQNYHIEQAILMLGLSQELYDVLHELHEAMEIAASTVV